MPISCATAALFLLQRDHAQYESARRKHALILGSVVPYWKPADSLFRLGCSKDAKNILFFFESMLVFVWQHYFMFFELQFLSKKNAFLFFFKWSECHEQRPQLLASICNFLFQISVSRNLFISNFFLIPWD